MSFEDIETLDELEQFIIQTTLNGEPDTEEEQEEFGQACAIYVAFGMSQKLGMPLDDCIDMVERIMEDGCAIKVTYDNGQLTVNFKREGTDVPD